MIVRQRRKLAKIGTERHDDVAVVVDQLVAHQRRAKLRHAFAERQLASAFVGVQRRVEDLVAHRDDRDARGRLTELLAKGKEGVFELGDVALQVLVAGRHHAHQEQLV